MLTALERYGFEAATTTPDGCMWTLSPTGSARYLYVHEHRDGQAVEYSIYVEEWRGGEGYEDEEFRAAEIDALLAALPRWVAWASEPFEQKSFRQRLRDRWWRG